jgi:disease resistance protein RPS2
MNGCGEKEFPSGTLPKLSHLQVFTLQRIFFSFILFLVTANFIKA